MLKLGLKASAEQFAPRELVELGVMAEQHSFESVTVSDHFQPWWHNGGHAPFSLAWMAAVGERTECIQIGTSVMTSTFRYNPAVVAQAFATMGCLYPGRIILGVGTGEALNEIATGFRGKWLEFKPKLRRCFGGISHVNTDVTSVQRASCPAARSRRPDAATLGGRPYGFRGRVLQDGRGFDL